MKKQSWIKWLRACAKNPDSPAQLPGDPAMLTGQDFRALEAIVACWELCACADEDGEKAALAAVRALLPALQPKCRPFARELIAFSMDWVDRDRLWLLAAGKCSHVYYPANEPDGSVECCLPAGHEGQHHSKGSRGEHSWECK